MAVSPSSHCCAIKPNWNDASYWHYYHYWNSLYPHGTSGCTLTQLPRHVLLLFCITFILLLYHSLVSSSSLSSSSYIYMDLVVWNKHIGLDWIGLDWNIPRGLESEDALPVNQPTASKRLLLIMHWTIGLGELDVERELLGRVKSLKLGYYGHVTRKYESLEKEESRDVHQETEVVVDNADVGRTTSSNGHGWRLLRQQDWLRIEIVGEESNPSSGGRHWTTTTIGLRGYIGLLDNGSHQPKGLSDYWINGLLG